jgi:hypothetical protein
MRYDAVYLFVDLDHASYNALKFHLPMVVPANPANKEGVTALQKEKTTTIPVWREDDDDEEEDDDDYFAMPKKCNKSTGKQNHKKTKKQSTLIQFWVQSLELRADVMDDEEEGVPNNDNGPTVEPKKYSMMDKKDWTMRIGGDRRIDPVRCTGETEHSALIGGG